MITSVQTKDGVKLRRATVEPIVPVVAAIEPAPIRGATYDSIAGVWRLGAFIVPTAQTAAHVPVRSAVGTLEPQQARIRAMSQQADVNAVKALLRKQKPTVGEMASDRLEYCLAVALLDAGIDPLTVQREAGCGDDG